MRAPVGAVELGVGVAYTAGLGIPDVDELGLERTEAPAVGLDESGRQHPFARNGLALGLDLGLRVTPGLRLGLSGQYQELATSGLGVDASARGVVAGVEATLVPKPFRSIGPWVALGSGYRMLWAVPEGDDNDVRVHGFELARFRLGVDVRGNERFSFGPFVGADLDYLMWTDPDGPLGNAALPDRQASVFFQMGISTTFAVAGHLREASVAGR
jgi:hypothetical protein